VAEKQTAAEKKAAEKAKAEAEALAAAEEAKAEQLKLDTAYNEGYELGLIGLTCQVPDGMGEEMADRFQLGHGFGLEQRGQALDANAPVARASNPVHVCSPSDEQVKAGDMTPFQRREQALDHAAGRDRRKAAAPLPRNVAAVYDEDGNLLPTREQTRRAAMKAAAAEAAAEA